jgi:hypothetical protein
VKSNQSSLILGEGLECVLPGSLSCIEVRILGYWMQEGEVHKLLGSSNVQGQTPQLQVAG